MVVLLLVIVWVAVLAPSFLRRRAEGSLQDSVGSFHRNLRILERTAPGGVSPANTRRASVAPGQSGFSGFSGFSESRTYTPVSSTPYRTAGSPRPRSMGRQQALRRRRDILLVLTGGTIGSALLGLVPGLGIMWALAGVLAVALACYVGLLIRIRNNAAEREMKLSFLPAPHAANPPAQPVYALQRQLN